MWVSVIGLKIIRLLIEMLLGVYISREIRTHHYHGGGVCWWRGSWQQEALSTHRLVYQTEKVNLGWWRHLKLQSWPPVTHFLQQDHITEIHQIKNASCFGFYFSDLGMFACTQVGNVLGDLTNLYIKVIYVSQKPFTHRLEIFYVIFKIIFFIKQNFMV